MPRNLQVFLVDDDEDEHFLFERTLNEIDVHIDHYHAYSGEELLEILHKCEHLPDLIFLDLNMPKMDGKECLWELKSQFNIPVVIYTTSRSEKDINDAKSIGAEWFLVKPNSIRTLKSSLQLILYDTTPPGHRFAPETGIYKFNAGA